MTTGGLGCCHWCVPACVPCRPFSYGTGGGRPCRRAARPSPRRCRRRSRPPWALPEPFRTGPAASRRKRPRALPGRDGGGAVASSRRALRRAGRRERGRAPRAMSAERRPRSGRGGEVRRRRHLQSPAPSLTLPSTESLSRSRLGADRFGPHPRAAPRPGSRSPAWAERSGCPYASPGRVIPTAPWIRFWFRTGGRVLLEGQNWGAGVAQVGPQRVASHRLGWAVPDINFQRAQVSKPFLIGGLLQGQVYIPDTVRLDDQILSSSGSATHMDLRPSQGRES